MAKLAVFLAVLGCVFGGVTGEGSPVQIITKPSNTTVFPGEVVVLPCSVEPEANVLVEWFKNGENITQSKRIKVGVVSKRLYIFETSELDAGWYSCKASNEHGSDSAKAYLHVIGDGPPFIFNSPSNATLHVSQEYYMTCEGKGLPAPQYTWLFEGQQIIDTSMLQTKGVLHMSYAELRHSGKYTCVIWNQFGSVNVSAYVNVLNDPTMTKSPEDTIAFLGKPAKLECILTASWGDVKKMWTKDSKELIESARVKSYLINMNTVTVFSLKFTEVFVSDEGSYTCAFGNNMGLAVSDAGKFTVVDPPSVHTDSSVVSIPKWEQGSMICSATGRPMPKIEWFVKGQQVTTSPSIVINNLSNKTSTISMLKIKNSEVKDEGIIVCRASNTVGISEKNITFLVIGEPEPPWNVMANLTSETIVAVSWNEGHQGGDKPSFIIQYRHKDDTGGKWEKEKVQTGQHITYLTGNKDWKNYHVRVVAVNKYSKSSPSEAVLIKDHNTYSKSTLKRSNSRSTTMLVVSIIGGIGLFALLMVILVVLYIKHSKKLKPKLGVTSATYTVGSGKEPAVTLSAGGIREGGQASTSSSKEFLDQDMQDGYTTVPAAKNWEIPKELLILEKIIGAGNFGQVVQAVLVQHKGINKQTVAVKMMKVGYTDKDLKDFLKELDLMKSIEPNPHVVSLVGCCTRSGNPYIVVEYLPNGNLLEFLQANRVKANDMYTNLPPSSKTLTSKELLSFALQITKGMSYLSSLRLVHRDLAARNVLLTEDNQCKISDFGLARDIYQDNLYLRTTMGHLPLRWMAYEAVFQGVSNVETDVWSFGVVVWEIVTLGAIPYPNMGRDQLLASLTQGYRMPKPSHCSDEIYEIMAGCWEEDPKNRPTFSQLSRALQKLVDMKETLIDLNSVNEAIYVNTNDLKHQGNKKPKVETEVRVVPTGKENNGPENVI